MISFKTSPQYRAFAAGAHARGVAALSLALVAVALSACTTLPDASSVAESEAPAMRLDSALQQFLSDAPAESTLALADSPWGANVVISVQAPYAAASGRTCRALTVESGADSRPGLACRSASGDWQPVRLLHYQGRPLLSASSERAESGVAP